MVKNNPKIHIPNKIFGIILSVRINVTNNNIKPIVFNKVIQLFLFIGNNSFSFL